jgi:hypothetical protein
MSRHRRFAGTLALFALALQIALSFGHIHLRDFAGVPGAGQTRATTTDPGGNNNRNPSTDDYCLICATANMAGTLVVPATVAVPTRLDTTDAWYGYFYFQSSGRIDQALFRARAPPLA